MRNQFGIHSLVNEMLRLPLEKQKKRLAKLRQSPNDIHCLCDYAKEKIDEIKRQKVNQIDEEDYTLYVVLHILAYLEETQIFSQFIRLPRLSEAKLERILGMDFSSEEAIYLFAYLTPNWQAMKPIIENTKLDTYWRASAIESLLYFFIQGKVSRNEIAHYLKYLLHTMTLQERSKKELIAFLIDTCADFYPAEMMEEIREAFGRWAVNLSIINIEDVQESLEQGEEVALAKLKRNLKDNDDLLDIIRSISADHDEDFIHQLEDEQEDDYLGECDDILTYLAESIESEESELLPISPSQTSQETFELAEASPLRHFSSTITFEPLHDELVDHLSPADYQKIIKFLESSFDENPEGALSFLLPFKEKYPNLPSLYNWICIAYFKSGKISEALDLLKESVKKFPRYLFRLTEYGRYLIRRGEHDRIPELLHNNFILEMLYPEREVFHIVEVKAFYVLMVEYFLAKKDIARAKIYFNILDELIPDDEIIEKLKFDIQIAERRLTLARLFES